MKNPKLKPMPTHEAVVLNQLKKRKKGLTSVEAFQLKPKRITRLSAHVHELKKQGHDIESVKIITKDGWYVRYKLVA